MSGWTPYPHGNDQPRELPCPTCGDIVTTCTVKLAWNGTAMRLYACERCCPRQGDVIPAIEWSQP